MPDFFELISSFFQVIIGLVIALLFCIFAAALVWFEWDNPLGWMAAIGIILGSYKGYRMIFPNDYDSPIDGIYVLIIIIFVVFLFWLSAAGFFIISIAILCIIGGIIGTIAIFRTYYKLTGKERDKRPQVTGQDEHTPQKGKVQEKGSKLIKRLFIIIGIAVIAGVISILTGIIWGGMITVPLSDNVSTVTQTAAPTLTQNSSNNQRCDISGKWVEIEQVGAYRGTQRYIQIYPNERVELYNNGKLEYYGPIRYWGSNNRFLVDWQSAPGLGYSPATLWVTVSDDCNSQSYQGTWSGAGAPSIFVRA